MGTTHHVAQRQTGTTHHAAQRQTGHMGTTQSILTRQPAVIKLTTTVRER